MPRTRSRAKTEEKFQYAVLELVAEEGCGALGVNAVAHRAGADKVLIYRYFENLNGLLHTVAESQQWLPSLDELCHALNLQTRLPAAVALHQLSEIVTLHIRANQTTHQILRWRKALTNPLTNHFSSQWKSLWQGLATRLSTDLDYEDRETWKLLTTLTALTIESTLCDEPVNTACLSLIAQDLTTGQMIESTDGDTRYPEDQDQLPTNLL
jgi:AcrR family transcriptional regulator